MPDTGILGLGTYVPPRIVTNNEAGANAGIDDEWITRKTAIRQRRWAEPHQATSDLATHAAHTALTNAHITPDQLTTIVVATSTPDRPQPPTAAYVQHQLRATNAAAFDINAVCSGEIFALSTIHGALTHRGGHALLIGADLYSRILNPTDPKTICLFGDGAGAMIISHNTPHAHLRHLALHTFGELAHLIEVPAGGSRLPTNNHTLQTGSQYFTMNGRQVRQFVEEKLPQLTKQFLHEAGVTPDDIHHFIPHQANGIMLETVFTHLALTHATMHQTLTHYGNTGAASIPITLDKATRENAFKPGDLILLAGFGGGMSAGFALLEW
ncbi:ketoacyl-ACP synthase III [Streptomyces sp. NA04227]|uniref:3-oxoacyl-ACP synthase III family protein n=1 Tax=Streptomyces sp. NA04227 TaxID=2742136 RepID=UPI00159236BA|nr:ketoacyl-ACP synthase III [Streptomyces sp. NA04227]QKW10551.1 ketoacyl-ACP synthase III [Streptomyces sp. NA04227]